MRRRLVISIIIGGSSSTSTYSFMLTVPLHGLLKSGLLSLGFSQLGHGV